MAKTEEEKKAYGREWYLRNREKRIKYAVAYKRANKDRNKVWMATYREKHAAEIAAYNAATKDMQKVRSRRRYENHKDEALAQCKVYYIENKEKVKRIHAAYRKANRDAIRIKQREYIRRKLETDPAFAFIHLARRRMLNALVGVGAKSARTVELLGCTGEEAVKHIEKQFVDGMSWANRKEWHIDHIKPVSKFDLSDPEEQKKAFHYTNLQPLWAWDNRSKGAK